MTFVAAGYAAMLVHSHLAAVDVDGVRVVPLVEPGPEYEVVVAWRAGDTSPAVARIRDVARGMVRGA